MRPITTCIGPSRPGPRGSSRDTGAMNVRAIAAVALVPLIGIALPDRGSTPIAVAADTISRIVGSATAGAGADRLSLPLPGNPGGVPLPAEAQPVDTSHPDRVIGTGTPASCTSQAVVAAVA